MIFSRNRNQDGEKGELILVFDVGSSSVGGAFLKMQKSGIPKMLATAREAIPLEETVDVDRFLSLTAKSLEIVADKLYKMSLGAPSRIFCILSSPWYASQTRLVSLKKNTPFIFTSKLADELIKKEISLFEEEYLAKYSKAGSLVRPIELKNIKTTLNGYETPEPLDKKTKELEMSIFISISPEQVLKKIEETIQQHFHFEEIKFSSFVMASFTVVRDIFTKEDNFLLFDIGGEVTDISMIKKSILQGSISFPLGVNFIIRGVASALRSSFGEAKSLVSILKDGHATEEVTAKVEAALTLLKKEWLQKFQESLANLSKDISVPSIIYIAVEKEFADFFSRTIQAEQFNQYTLTESKFKIIFLDTEVFHGMTTFEGDTVRDSGLIIDSIYINRFFN